MRKVVNHKRSVVFEDILARLRVGKYHLDHIKIFCPRDQDREIEEVTELAAGNHEQRQVVDAFTREFQRLNGRESRLSTNLLRWKENYGGSMLDLSSNGRGMRR